MNSTYFKYKKKKKQTNKEPYNTLAPFYPALEANNVC